MEPTNFRAPHVGTVAPVVSPDGPYYAFFPEPIPRSLRLSEDAQVALSRADQALGRLAGAGRHLPNPHLLVQPYITREAVSSSRIEGTQASLSEVFDANAEVTPITEDIKEVRNYIRALQTGLDLLPHLPISKRLVATLHKILLDGVRGRDKTPGEFRRIQNYIGSPDRRPHTARFVPPPAGEIMEAALADWERFTHEDETKIPLLVRCALLHYQFETIHPFIDGNGRMGRLLIVLFLVEQGALPSPLLYLSSYFEMYRSEYNDHLQDVRESGSIDEWVTFFLRGVEVQAVDAVSRAERLADLNRDFRERLRGSRTRAGEVVDLLFQSPVTSAPIVASRLRITNQGATNLLRQLNALEIVRPASPPTRGATTRWLAPEVLRVLSD